ncbi:MAG: DNA cytosine methyltransferase [Caldilineaceae bacterium]
MTDSKIERLKSGGQPRVLDLFSGCGGISLGFNLAGCNIIGGVESDRHAAQSHADNFHRTDPKHLIHAQAKDVTVTNPYALLESYGYDDPENSVDILVGGPPCPAFARVGRAKLREVNEHPEAFRQDPRAKLYLPYLDYVSKLRPVALLMENVPDILNFGGHNLGEEICEILEEELGYTCTYTLLNSANYGVPQMRERFFLVAIRSDIATEYKFPLPTRKVDFPQGYMGSRQVALKFTEPNGLFHKSHFQPTPQASADCPPPVTVREAIEDLPEIFGHLTGTIKRGARRFDKYVGYRSDTDISSYAQFMRSWPGFESTGKLWDHVIRSLSERDYRLFRSMSPNDDYPKAHALANRLFEDALAEMKHNGNGMTNDTTRYDKLKALYVPPYDPGKFPNKWRKMEPSEPARTLMAHLGKDSYSHIHYDSAQARVLSVREAARLQSFPDGFAFSGTMNPAFRQIGNAVPPLLSFVLSVSILNTIYSHLDYQYVDRLCENLPESLFNLYTTSPESWGQ